MFQKKLIIFLLLVISSVSAQNQMSFVDGKTYEATQEWNFPSEKYAYGQFLFQIAKTPTGGILKITAEVSNTLFYIGGNVYIDFEDTNFIICTDKNIRAIEGNKVISYYRLTAKEMESLKIKPILNIRFRIIGDQTEFSSKTGHFTVYNHTKSFTKILQTAFKYDTHIEVLNLYK